MDVENRSQKIVSEDIRRKIQEFRLMDDEFMTACFEGQPGCMELILRIILDRSDLVVDSVDVQMYLKNLQGRSLQLDLHSQTDGSEYNVEFQRDAERAMPKRARYHGSVMDANALKAGEDFDRLPETYVIFVTEDDYYGCGEAVYHVERFVTNADGGRLFDDGLHILYVNGAYAGDDDMGRLMHDFRCKDPEDMNYSELKERTRYFKETEEGVRKMSEVMKSYVDEEVHKEKLKTAVKMLENGKLSCDEISKILDLPLEEVEELAGKKSA